VYRSAPLPTNADHIDITAQFAAVMSVVLTVLHEVITLPSSVDLMTFRPP
jgi:hypothetical protein